MLIPTVGAHEIGAHTIRQLVGVSGAATVQVDIRATENEQPPSGGDDAAGIPPHLPRSDAHPGPAGADDTGSTHTRVSLAGPTARITTERWVPHVPRIAPPARLRPDRPDAGPRVPREVATGRRALQCGRWRLTGLAGRAASATGTAGT